MQGDHNSHTLDEFREEKSCPMGTRTSGLEPKNSVIVPCGPVFLVVSIIIIIIIIVVLVGVRIQKKMLEYIWNSFDLYKRSKVRDFSIESLP